MNEDYFRELLRRYREGKCTEKEIRLLDEWYENLGGEVSYEVGSQTETLKDESWNDLLMRRADIRLAVENQEYVKSIRQYRRYWGWVAAGVAALLLSAGLFLFPENSPVQQMAMAADVTAESVRTERAPENGTRLLVLSDGSRVTLYPGSELSYGPDFNLEKRELHLKGEAYFEVAENKAKPFLVYASNVVTKVLGTSFLVKAHADVEVLVTKGKVTVFRQDQEEKEVEPVNEVVLLPQQQVLYSVEDDQLRQSEFTDIDLPTGKPTHLVFENAPLHAILESIEASYQIEFQFDEEAFGLCRLTTSLDDESLEEILGIIAGLLDAKFEHSGKVIRLTGNGCAAE